MYKLITLEESEEKNMYMILDTLNIFYKKPIKNSIRSANIVLNFFGKFMKEINQNCGDLYIVKVIDNGAIYYGCCCDGLINNHDEMFKKHGIYFSSEFEKYCDKISLILDYGDIDK